MTIATPPRTATTVFSLLLLGGAALGSHAFSSPDRTFPAAASPRAHAAWPHRDLGRLASPLLHPVDPFSTTSIGRISRGGGRHDPPPLSTTTSLPSAVSFTDGDDGRNEIRDDESNILAASILVGAVTAAMGYVYGKVLGACVKTVWTAAPLALAAKLGGGEGALSAKWFITGTLTLGGLLVGILSSQMNSRDFTVADFVSAFSSVPAEARELPRSRSALGPLLLLSLVTSAFGFSVGPEAPMVCAGGLVGTSIARKLYGDDRTADDADKDDDSQPSRGQPRSPKAGYESKSEAAFAEHLAYAGAAGALTAFMGMPIAGSIFALELTRSGAGLSSGARDALSPAVAASVAAIAVIRALLSPEAAVGGHFAYGALAEGAISGRAMMLTAAGCGVGGALLGTVFHKVVALMKSVLWPAPKAAAAGAGHQKGAWKRTVLTKTLIGLAVGLLSSYYPQTLFWGEGSLQCVVDGQRTAFGATKHGIPALLTTAAKVDPSLPFATAKAAASVGAVKLLSIALACAGKFPGGIIFPLFFAAAPFAHAAALAGWTSGGVLPLAVMCLMASTQASVTRTPLATALILTLSASAGTQVSVMLPACLVSSYLGVYVSQLLSSKTYFSYTK